MNDHPGISMHEMPVGANVGGVMCTLGAVLIVLLGLPIAKFFLLAAIVGGLAVMGLLRLIQRHATPPISIRR